MGQGVEGWEILAKTSTNHCLLMVCANFADGLKIYFFQKDVMKKGSEANFGLALDLRYAAVAL